MVAKAKESLDGLMATEAELVTQLRTRGLVRTIADRECWPQGSDQCALLEELASILNSTDAPPIDLYIEEALAELKGPRFFFVQHVLCDLIPHLNVDQEVLLGFIAHLLDAGSNDMAAGAPSSAFGEWTKKDPARSSKVYEAARAGNSPALRQLFTVLVMNEDIEEGLLFAQAEEPEAKRIALSALGAMELGERYDEALNTLLQGASSNDENTALRSIEVGYRAAAQRKTLAVVGFDEQLERVLRARSSLAIHLAVNLLWLHRIALTENAINLCLAAAADVDPSNADTILHLDHATYQLVGAGHVEKVICLLSKVIDRSKGQITLDAFQNTYYALQMAGADVLGGAVVYWLLNGGTHTRQCVASEVCSVGKDDPSFSIPRLSLPPDPLDQLFLCRKAVGWFFIDPLAAVAIPLAVLRDGSPDVASDVLNLIYDPLLLSYGDKLKSYLERAVAEGGANSSSLAELLARKAALQGAKAGIERLVELHPSEMQREAARVQWHEQMAPGVEQGRRKSIFENLCAKQYILYGRSSLVPIHTDGGTTRLTETKMESFSISSELPLLSIVDPVGLDHMLFHFRFEQREQQ